MRKVSAWNDFQGSFLKVYSFLILSNLLNWRSKGVKKNHEKKVSSALILQPYPWCKIFTTPSNFYLIQIENSKDRFRTWPHKICRIPYLENRNNQNIIRTRKKVIKESDVLLISIRGTQILNTKRTKWKG